MYDIYQVVNYRRFRPYVVGNARLETLHTGTRWAEGPVWFADAGCLLLSDVPSNRILRWVEGQGASVSREPSDHANGNTRDRQGRLHVRRRAAHGLASRLARAACAGDQGRGAHSGVRRGAASTIRCWPTRSFGRAVRISSPWDGPSWPIRTSRTRPGRGVLTTSVRALPATRVASSVSTLSWT